jgi:hypothetical protein
MKQAVLQVSDSGPLESLVAMLGHAGYQCYLPTKDLQNHLRGLGCDTVLEVADLVRVWGYDWPRELPAATTRLMDSCDLYVDVKAHRNGPKVWDRWPRLRGRTLWYRINGGMPEHVVRGGEDCGDEVNPPARS